MRLDIPIKGTFCEQTDDVNDVDSVMMRVFGFCMSYLV